MSKNGFIEDFKRSFLTGFAALFPIVVTLILFAWLYHQVDATIGTRANALLRQILAWSPALFGMFFPSAQEHGGTAKERLTFLRENFPPSVGLVIGLALLAVLVYLLGKFLRGYIGGRAMTAMDRFFTRFPVIKAVYPYARQVADFVFGQRERRAFSDVVAVEYPRRGVYSLGFRTGSAPARLKSKLSRDFVTVLIPTSPTPLTGFVLLVPPDEVVSLDISVDEAFRFFITAGMLSADPSGRAAPGEEVLFPRR